MAIFLADQNPHRDRSRGITEMTRCLLAQLKRYAELQLVPVVSASSYRDPDLMDVSLRIPWRTDHMLGRLSCDALHPWLARAAVDLWYYPKGYLSLVRKPKVPAVGTMHDAIIQHYADHYSHSRHHRDLNYWIRVTKRSLRKLDLVLTVSHHGKDQLLRFCDRYQIAPPPIAVTYESSDWEQHIGTEFEKSDYVVHLASDAPHKKTNHLLSMWLTLQNASKDLPRLRLIGGLDDEGQALRSQIKHVEQIPHLSHAELVMSVGQARALLLPSEIEGFGLPALEAYYVGTPVCYVRHTAIEEVIGDAGASGAFELNSVDEFLLALDAALNMPLEQIRMIRDDMYARFASHLIAHEVVSQCYRAAGRKPNLSAPIPTWKTRTPLSARRRGESPSTKG